MNQRTLRRNGGFFSKTMGQMPWHQMEDFRHARGKRWQLRELLGWTLLGLLTGAKGVADVERLSDRASHSLKRLCKLPLKRLADTTLRTFLCGLNWKVARFVLHSVAYQCERSKRLEPEFGFPYGVLSMDGKYESLPTWEGPFAQRTEVEGHKPYGKLRCITAVLTSSASRPCLDASPISKHTNESGHFKRAFDEVNKRFGHLFQMVTYDAGALSESNAAHVVDEEKHYLLHINNENQHQYQQVKDLLAMVAPAATVEDGHGIKRTIRIFGVNSGKLPKNETYVKHIFPHARTLLRVDSEYTKEGKRVYETRYFISSEQKTVMAPAVWLRLIVRHWAVETCHQHLDVAFAEDKHPWIQTDANGALVMMLLRRAAYTLLAMFKERTLRNDDLKGMSWAKTLEWLRDSAIAFNQGAAKNIRHRKPVESPLQFQ